MATENVSENNNLSELYENLIVIGEFLKIYVYMGEFNYFLLKYILQTRAAILQIRSL